MNRNNNITLIEDSTGSKYCFTYKDSSIYCKEATCHGDIKESLLVSQVDEDFAAAICTDDIIYLLCHNRSKGILLFTHSKNSWVMSEILYSQSDITLLNMFIVKGSIHILYATKLPIANYHNVYHLNNIYGYWEKNNISEIFSENVHLSFSSTITDNDYIHFINVWHDGKKHILNNCTYNSSNNSWSSKKLAALMSNNITIELIAEGNNLHLLFHAFEDDISLLFYFLKKSSDNDDFNFISLNKMVIGTPKYMPIYKSEDGNIFMEWISDNNYYKHIFDMSLREWKPQIEYPLVRDISFDLITLIKNEKNRVSMNKVFCTVNNELNMQKTYEDTAEVEMLEPEETDEASEEDDIKKSNNIDDLVPYLIDQIKNLSDDIKNINTKLNIKDHSSSTDKASQKEPDKKATAAKQSEYSKSKFKDDFFNNRISPTSLSIRTTSTPQSIISINSKQSKNIGSFKDAFMSSSISNTSNHTTGAVYHGASKNTKAYTSPDNIHQGKLNYADPNVPKKEENSSIAANETNTPEPFLPDPKEKNDITAIFKKIGDYFKQNL